MEGGKPENPEKNLRSKERINNNLNPSTQMPTTGTGPGPQRWEASALTTTPTLLPIQNENVKSR